MAGYAYEQSYRQVAVQEAVTNYLTSPAVKYLSPRTLEEYQQELRRFSDWAQRQVVLLDQVNARTVCDFIDYVKIVSTPALVGKSEISTYTLHSQVRVIVTFLNWCLDDDEYASMSR